MSSTNSVSMEQLHDEWRGFERLIAYVIRRKLARVLERYDDEFYGEASAHAWERFATCRQHFDSAKQAAITAARFGASRALRGTRFVRREPGYQDAMDRRRAARVAPAVLQGIPAAGDNHAVMDASDRTVAESVIAILPGELQATARLLSYGMPRRMVAERRGVSLPTVCRQVEHMRDELAGLAGGR